MVTFPFDARSAKSNRKPTRCAAVDRADMTMARCRHSAAARPEEASEFAGFSAESVGIFPIRSGAPRRQEDEKA
jgi:hypothetical protein